MIPVVADALVGMSPAILAAFAVAGAVLAVRRTDGVVVGRAAAWPIRTVRRSPGAVVDRVGRIAWVQRLARAEVGRARLAEAHARFGIDRYVGARAVAAAVLACLAMMGRGLVLVPVVVAAALVLPDLVLARIARRRRARIEAQLPQFLDLLAAGSTAGLSALLALRRAAESVREPLAGELAGMLERVDLGARWRDELREMAERLHLADLRRAVMAMSRTESLGTPLAESLRRRADEVREARRAQAAERARKAPVKMLFPLVFMILPAFLLLTVVPVLLSTLRSVR